MSSSHAAKECGVFTRACKSTAYSTKKFTAPENVESSKMADIADVLTELKRLRTEFGQKLDGINRLHRRLSHWVRVVKSSCWSHFHFLLSNFYPRYCWARQSSRLTGQQTTTGSNNRNYSGRKKDESDLAGCARKLRLVGFDIHHRNTWTVRQKVKIVFKELIWKSVEKHVLLSNKLPINLFLTDL